MSVRRRTARLAVVATVMLGACLLSTSAQRLGKHKVVLDARTMTKTIVDENGTATTYLDSTNATEVDVRFRKFLTTFSVAVTSNKVAAPFPIRDLEEASNLTLGPGTLITPSKGAGDITPLTLRNASDMFLLLLDESTSEQPRTMLEQDYQELVTEKTNLTLKLTILQQQEAAILGAAPAAAMTCDNVGSATFTAVIYCLERERDYGTGTALPGRPEPFIGPGHFQTGEQTFVLMNVWIQDRLSEIAALQASITQTDLATSAGRFDSSLTQFEKNIDTFRGTLRSMQSAVHLYNSLAPGALKALRGAQLKAHLAGQLKTSPTDTTSALDAAELNTLVQKYLDSQMTDAGNPRPNTIANINALSEESVCLLQAMLASADVASLTDIPLCAGTIPTQLRTSPENVLNVNAVSSLRTNFIPLQLAIGTTLPALTVQINDLQSQVVKRANYIYDNSEVSEPQILHLDVTKFPGNEYIYFAIQYTEAYARYTVQTPLTATIISNTAPVSAPAAAVAPIAVVPAGSGVPSPPTALTTAANAAHVPVLGPIEVHEFQVAAVIAEAAFSSIRSNSYATQQLNFDGTTAHPYPTTGPCVPASSTAPASGPTCYMSYRTSSEIQPQVMIGLMYYLRLHDSFPNLKYNFSQDSGIVVGVSANTANTFFLGVATEPKPALNIGLGMQFGYETRLQNSVLQLNQTTSSSPPTNTVRVQKPYVSIGLDLSVFRKVFGKVFGFGTSSSPSS